MSSKGQAQIITTIITAGAMLIGAFITSWATASNRVGIAETKIAVVEERENNHYAETQKQLQEVNAKLDKISDKLGVKK